MSDNFEAHIEALKQMGRRVLRRLSGSGGTEDPFAAARVPRNRNPLSLAGAIALPEPEDDVRVEVVARRSA